MTIDDHALIREYVELNSDEAFSTLVTRYVNLVYSIALRQTRNPHLAEEITQGVFVTLARKATSLPPKTILAGWLCRTARYLSANALRNQRHRQSRELESYMQFIENRSDSSDWAQISPLLDEALSCLGEDEHDAVILRFFDEKDLRAVGAALGATEDAARMRVNRGLEKLRKFFARKGVTLSAAAIAAAITANSVQAAPAGLAATASFSALSATPLNGGALLTATKSIAMTTFQKIAVSAALALALGTGLYEARQAARAQAEIASNRQQLEPLTEQFNQAVRERDEAKRQIAALQEENARLHENGAEVLKLRGELGVLRRELGTLKSAGPPRVAQNGPENPPVDPVEATKRVAMNKGMDGRNYAGQFALFAANNQGWFPTNWQQVINYSKDFPVSGTNEFEIVHSQPFNRSELADNMGRTALIREFLAWPTPDGRWGKIYGFADGHSEPVILSDGNFSAWEQENTFNPPNRPAVQQ